MRQPATAEPRGHQEGDLIADKYQLVRLIGTGGMGTVWIAHNLALDVHVAIKLIRAESASEGTSGRLLQEARAAARLGHPGIVRVFDFGRTELFEPYIVMELLDGESLADALDRRKRISATRAVQMLLPIADALSVAHSKGIVHRDLKPENVYLHRIEGGRTQPKLVDFGIALHDRDVDRRITQDGAVMGSPSYMSPEQARGEEHVDHRADIWSFAVVLYETMTGVAPFSGPNNLAILRQVVELRPRPLTDLGAGDEGLWKILERALRKHPDERWQSMRAMGSALALWLSHQGVEDDICGASLSATWLKQNAGKDVLSSRPPPPGPEEAPNVVTPDMRVSAAPRISSSDSLAFEAARHKSGPPRRRFARFMLSIVVLALLGGGFWLTRNFLNGARTLGPLPWAAAEPTPPAAPSPTPVAAAVAAPVETVRPAAAETVAPVAPVAPVATSEVLPEDPRVQPAAKPRAQPRAPRRASTSKAPAAASDLKMPY